MLWPAMQLQTCCSVQLHHQAHQYHSGMLSAERARATRQDPASKGLHESTRIAVKMPLASICTCIGSMQTGLGTWSVQQFTANTIKIACLANGREQGCMTADSRLAFTNAEQRLQLRLTTACLPLFWNGLSRMCLCGCSCKGQSIVAESFEHS